MNEIEIIRGIKRGDENCFSELYESWFPALYQFVLSYVKSSAVAKDIAHESLVKLWVRRELLDEKRSVKAYLFTMCKNALIKELRRQVKSPNIKDYLVVANALDVEQRISFDYDKYLAGIAAAKSTLSPRQRQIFSMSREEDRCVRDISESLGIGEQVVRNQLSIALKKIRAYLSQHSFIIVILHFVPLILIRR